MLSFVELEEWSMIVEGDDDDCDVNDDDSQ